MLGFFMANIYLIDGNNLIGKIPHIHVLQKKDKQGSRDKLAAVIDRAFLSKNIDVQLFFDGFPGIAIKSSKIKIYYSNEKTADDIIKQAISDLNNYKLATVVSSDLNVQEFAKVCGCKIIKAEDFYSEYLKKNDKIEEEDIQKSISDDEIKRMFGV